MHNFKYLLVHQTTKRNSYVDSQYYPTDNQINVATNSTQIQDNIYENDTNGNLKFKLNFLVYEDFFS